jgi:hypothetical protein
VAEDETLHDGVALEHAPWHEQQQQQQQEEEEEEEEVQDGHAAEGMVDSRIVEVDIDPVGRV